MKREIGTLKIGTVILLSLAICVGCSRSTAVSPTVNVATPSPTATLSTPSPTATPTTIVPNSVVYTTPQADVLLSSSLYNNLYQSHSGNVFFSPFSIITALAMAQEGAVGNTATQMQNVLNLNGNPTIRQQGFQQLMNEINSPGKHYTLNTANNLWIQQGFNILSSYINTVQIYYDAGVTNVDFIGNASGALQTINGAVSQETAGYVPDLLSPNNINAQTRLVLTNAIYFQANWMSQFVTTGTIQQPFNLDSGGAETVSMMHQMFRANLGDFNGVAAVLAMPFEDNEASMYIFLPPQGGTAALENLMSGSNINTWLAANAATLATLSSLSPQVSLALPKFSFSESYDLKSTLEQMGMPLAFSPSADFSGIDGFQDLFISDVVHKADIQVTESGTTAAAATAVIIGTTTGIITIPNSQIVSFTADHPFIFMIVENTTNTVLFMGRVSDPLAN